MENVALERNNIGIKDLLKYKSFMIKLIAYSISRFGDSIDAIAYAWMVYELTGSKLLMGTLFAVNAIPNIVLSPFAGIFADRHSKKKIIILGNLFRGIVVSFTAILFYYNLLRPWHLFIFTVLNSTFESFISPANSVLNASLVPKELYLTANSFTSSVNTFSELIGLALAGVIISIFKISGAILIDGMTFFIACILLSFIKYTENIEIKKRFKYNILLQ
ncbi:MAG: MFS transporter [Caloramator sp.]|nr:MFS transporter [Caloramator sp.]